MHIGISARPGAIRSALGGVLVAVLVVGLAAPTGASPGGGGAVVARAGASAVRPPAPAPVRYVKKPHDATIYAVEGIEHRRLTYAQWLAAGSPAPEPSRTEFVRYPWSSTVYAVTYWSAAVRDWDRLTVDTWSAAGRPEPRTTGWIPGSAIYRWDSSPELFLRGADRSLHKLTEREWAATGYRAPAVRTNQGFVKLSWNGSIARMSDLRYGQGRPISYGEWLAEGSPTPRVAARFPGDIFEKDFSGPAIRYSGPTVQKYLTHAEWQAAGAPAPYTGRNGRLDTSTLCPVSWNRSVLLRCDAQRALERLNSAYWGRFGRSMSIGYGYRTYATQVYLRMTLGTVAAVPGTSNHGWGLALDTAEGAQHGFGSPSYEWLKVNAPAFGWHAPRWAWQDGSNPEYWHFEYTG